MQGKGPVGEKDACCIMYIDMRWEDESGKELAAVISPPRSQFAMLVPGKSAQEFQCLGRLSTYGDVSFDGPHVPQLIQDLEKIASRCKTDDTRRHVKAMLDVARRASRRVHSSIRFSGD